MAKEEGELVVVNQVVTRTGGLCQGTTRWNLIIMIFMWILTAINY